MSTAITTTTVIRIIRIIGTTGVVRIVIGVILLGIGTPLVSIGITTTIGVGDTAILGAMVDMAIGGGITTITATTTIQESKTKWIDVEPESTEPLRTIIDATPRQHEPTECSTTGVQPPLIAAETIAVYGVLSASQTTD